MQLMTDLAARRDDANIAKRLVDEITYKLTKVEATIDPET